MTVTETFGARLDAAMAERGQLCVGIDPHSALLEQWGLPDDASGARAMGAAVVEAAAGRAAAVKPNAAFFERFGSAGLAALEDTLGAAREAGLITILDSKRGDIGSTMEAYVASTLVPGSPFEADAMTVSPYLGFDSVDPAWDACERHGKGVFVLALTSNKGAPELQHARTKEGPSVAAAVASYAAARNKGASPIGSCGLVVGATVGEGAVAAGVDLPGVHGPILAPGVGAQGATLREVEMVFRDVAPFVLISQSRSILREGPDVDKLGDAIQVASVETRALRQ